MAGNSFGNIFKLTTFGESHGFGIGGVIDGCPSGVKIDLKMIENDLNRRKPGQSKIVTQRKEDDEFIILSGLVNNITTGSPIGFYVKNKDQRSKDYNYISNTYRPSHADFVYEKKYGIRDFKGGGRSSARETISRVFGGAIAKQVLNKIKFTAYVSSVGNISIENDQKKLNFSNIEKNPVRCPDIEAAKVMEDYIKKIKKEGDTVGGIISCVIENVPVGLGQPVFDKLHAELGKAMLSINAVKGFEIGSGFYGTRLKGSAHNDQFKKDGSTFTNNSGGIQGGISNGMDIVFNVAFKPVSTIMKSQKTIDSKGNEVLMKGRGRHDPCVVPRAVPIVEAMAALVILDYYLLNKTVKLK